MRRTKPEKRPSPQRRRALHGLVLAGAGGSLALALRSVLAAAPAPGMRRIRGEVLIDGKPAAIGQPVLPGQQVATGPGAEAVFVIGDNAFLQHENSRFDTDDSTGVLVLRYLTGKILSVFGKGRKRLQTPTATIGIRGTACYIEAAPESVYFCLCYGSADISPLAKPAMRKRIRTTHHEHPMTIGSRSSDVMAWARVVNHTDAELSMLEALCGRRPPFQGKRYKPE